jgi:hypothetical protein
MEKSNSLSTQPMTKEDFLIVKSDSSTSSNSDEQKKLTKKQAKKLAKEHRKNHGRTDDNDKLVNEVSKITLQTNSNDTGKILSEEKEDKLPDMPKVTSHAKSYRRHMSESQVDLEATSNGEFKLKVL